MRTPSTRLITIGDIGGDVGRVASARSGGPRINGSELVMITVIGQICSPLERDNPYRIGQDGVPRVLPGSGGIVLSHRVGDPCVGLAADHVEPGVSIRNEQRVKNADGPNLALQTYACVGNWAVATTGRCAGTRGVVTGKHGGVDNVLVDFPPAALRRMAIGDRIQVYAYGLGLRLVEHPTIAVSNCSPRLIQRWGLEHGGSRLRVPVTHRIPARVMGSGLGRNNVERGDFDIQLFDRDSARAHGLDTLRFGDLVAIVGSDNRFGRSYVHDRLSIGVVVHSDSTVAGHGPGVVSLLTGPASDFDLDIRRCANIARLLGIRTPAAPRRSVPLVARGATARRAVPSPRHRAHVEEVKP
jgi:hypothetical protein